MTLRKLTYEQISILISDKEKIYGESGESIIPESIIIIPYTWVVEGDQEQSYLLFLNNKNGERNVITDFGGEYNYSSIDEYISSSLNEKTLETLIVSNKYVQRNCVFYATVDVDQQQHEFLVSFSPIFAFLNLGTSTKTELNEVISNFIDNYKQKLRMHPKNYNFLINLVYMTRLDFYYLSRRTTFPIKDEDSEEHYELNVEDGMLFDENLIELYQSKKGDIPVSVIYDQNANFPFRVFNFSQISPILANNMFNLFKNEEIDIFE